MTLVERIVELARRNGDLNNHALGELDTLLDRHVNTSSTDQSRWFLYGIRKNEKDTAPARIHQHCAFEPHYIKEKGANTAKLATDKTTLLKIWRKTKDRRAELMLRLTDLRTQLDDYLGCRIDDDGRIRASINIAGTESARHTAYKSNTGSGYNLHTTPSGHKHLFRADDGYWMGSLDLSGADGWTIACECLALGDSTMLDDLRSGLKPAQLVALLYKHGADANKWSRIQLLAALSTIKDPPWLYLACKRIIWGSCYGMGEQKMSEQVLEDSFDPDSGVEPVYVEPKICRALQNLVHTRYPGIRRRQDRIRMLLERDGCLEAANGMRRQFFGRKDDPMIQRDAFGWHPQVMTTWMTELAWLRLWRDAENRDARGEPIVQPLLLVHDSLLSQWPKERTPWACAKLREWFTNSIEIAGTRVTIPFSGHYGQTWAHASDIGEYKAEGKI